MSNILTARKISSLFDGPPSEEININDIMAILLQISLALLMIFFIADLLFRSKTLVEFEKAKDELTYYQEKYNDVMSTEVGQQYELREEALIEKQRQVLLNALEKVEAQDREKLGLTLFTHAKPDGSVELVVEGILSGDKITDNPIVKTHFIEGCRFAKEKMPFQVRMENDWLSRVLSLTGMHIKNESIPITIEPETLTRDNEVWLKQEIRKKIEALYTDCRTLQRMAITQLQNYYLDHLEELKDTDIYKLIRKYNVASPEEQDNLILPIRDMVHQHAKSVFEKEGAPLLSDV